MVLALAVAVAAFVVVRLAAPPPMARVSVVLRSHPVGGSVPVLPWPSTGQAGVSVPALGLELQSPAAEPPVPVASLTKMMTAYVVLRSHPLTSGAHGPDVEMTPADVADFEEDTVTDQISVALTPGEVLTERQLLEGMLVHSADDFADALARWDAGSMAAFVADMNSAAATLKMPSTHFADASGFDPGSMSTAADLLKLAAADMAMPVFAAIVDSPSVDLPGVGTVDSYTPLVGTAGVVGVKSGFTSAAGGCDVLALHQVVGGRPALVLSVVTGLVGPNVVTEAGLAAFDLAATAAGRLRIVEPVRAGSTVAHVSVDGRVVGAVATGAVSLLAWPGQVVRESLRVTAPLPAGTGAGSRLGTATISLGRQRMSVPVRIEGGLPPPALLQKLF